MIFSCKRTILHGPPDGCAASWQMPSRTSMPEWTSMTRCGMPDTGLCTWDTIPRYALCQLTRRDTARWGGQGRGRRLERDAGKRAQRLKHPPSLALGLSFVGEAQVARRDVAAAMATAQELLALCDEHRLPQPRATALMFFGWALAQRGD